MTRFRGVIVTESSSNSKTSKSDLFLEAEEVFLPVIEPIVVVGDIGALVDCFNSPSGILFAATAVFNIMGDVGTESS